MSSALEQALLLRQHELSRRVWHNYRPREWHSWWGSVPRSNNPHPAQLCSWYGGELWYKWCKLHARTGTYLPFHRAFTFAMCVYTVMCFCEILLAASPPQIHMSDVLTGIPHYAMKILGGSRGDCIRHVGNHWPENARVLYFSNLHCAWNCLVSADGVLGRCDVGRRRSLHIYRRIVLPGMF